MSDVQQEHALAVEQLVPRLAALRIELCPNHMSERCFWKIYFMLVYPRLDEKDAEMLFSPQVFFALYFRIFVIHLWWQMVHIDEENMSCKCRLLLFNMQSSNFNFYPPLIFSIFYATSNEKYLPWFHSHVNMGKCHASNIRW